MKESETKQYFSTVEVAKILKISRIAVFRKIQTGKLKAVKAGRNYIVTKEDLEALLGLFISPDQKKEIDDVVKKAVKKYRTAFRRLGEEN